MIKNNVKNIVLLCSVAILAVTTISGFDNAFAEAFSYKIVDDVVLTTTFVFRDGLETPAFTEFSMGENYINKKTTSFELQGPIGKSPMMHKALDDAYKYRNSGSHEWDYRYFDVIVNFSRNEETIQQYDYYNCEIASYHIDTENDDYESYTSSKSGFAIIDVVDFVCGGIDPMYGFEERSHTDGDFVTIKHGITPFEFDRNIRTFVTFEFDYGVEKIEFPIFELTSGYEEEGDNVIPSFIVQGVIMKHPLLTEAVERSRLISGSAFGTNIDFDANVEFVSNEKLLRGLDFKNCRVTGYEVFTSNDNEEPYTGKSGFAQVEEIEFSCEGLKGLNPDYESLMGSTWKTTFVEHKLPNHEYRTPASSHAIATFTFTNGVEVVDFPFFENRDVLQRADEFEAVPAFTVQGPVDSHPMLFKRADANLKLTSATGTNPVLELFSVDIDFMYGDEKVRGLSYRECRITDYVIESETSKEETYFKKMATTQIYDFECNGYHGNNPLYDAMFVVEKASTTSSADLKDTSNWDPGFYAE